MTTLYMIELALPNPITAEFMELIPKNLEVTNQLLSEGKIQYYTVSLERSKVWMVVQAETEFEAQSILAELPLSLYMTPTFFPTTFHQNTNNISFPAISLN